LRVVEILGMVQARQWGVCTMNEFRQFLGLIQFKTFEEWNPDVEIAVSHFIVIPHVFLHTLYQSAARRLYGHIDKLELYVRH
jgi:hypothetical protein